jgi:2'-5' RNA ligase
MSSTPSSRDPGPPEFGIEPDRTHRLFLAIPLPGGIIDALADIQSRLRKGFQFTACRPSWPAPRSMHLTVRFLGDTPGGSVPALIGALEEALRGHPPISLTARGLGVFPDWRRPKVLWVGIEDPGGGLARIHQTVEKVVQTRGYDADRPEFHPHLTLARFRSLKGVQAAKNVVLSHRQFKSKPFPVEELTLFRSELRPEGAAHQAVRRFALAG